MASNICFKQIFNYTIGQLQPNIVRVILGSPFYILVAMATSGKNFKKMFRNHKPLSKDTWFVGSFCTPLWFFLNHDPKVNIGPTKRSSDFRKKHYDETSADAKSNNSFMYFFQIISHFVLRKFLIIEFSFKFSVSLSCIGLMSHRHYTILYTMFYQCGSYFDGIISLFRNWVFVCQWLSLEVNYLPFWNFHHILLMIKQVHIPSP